MIKYPINKPVIKFIAFEKITFFVLVISDIIGIILSLTLVWLDLNIYAESSEEIFHQTFNGIQFLNDYNNGEGGSLPQYYPCIIAVIFAIDLDRVITKRGCASNWWAFLVYVLIFILCHLTCNAITGSSTTIVENNFTIIYSANLGNAPSSVRIVAGISVVSFFINNRYKIKVRNYCGQILVKKCKSMNNELIQDIKDNNECASKLNNIIETDINNGKYPFNKLEVLSTIDHGLYSYPLIKKLSNEISMAELTYLKCLISCRTTENQYAMHSSVLRKKHVLPFQPTNIYVCSKEYYDQIANVYRETFNKKDSQFAKLLLLAADCYCGINLSKDEYFNAHCISLMNNIDDNQILLQIVKFKRLEQKGDIYSTILMCILSYKGFYVEKNTNDAFVKLTSNDLKQTKSATIAALRCLYDESLFLSETEKKRYEVSLKMKIILMGEYWYSNDIAEDTPFYPYRIYEYYRINFKTIKGTKFNMTSAIHSSSFVGSDIGISVGSYINSSLKTEITGELVDECITQATDRPFNSKALYKYYIEKCEYVYTKTFFTIPSLDNLNDYAKKNIGVPEAELVYALLNYDGDDFDRNINEVVSKGCDLAKVYQNNPIGRLVFKNNLKKPYVKIICPTID